MRHSNCLFFFQNIFIMHRLSFKWWNTSLKLKWNYCWRNQDIQYLLLVFYSTYCSYMVQITNKNKYKWQCPHTKVIFKGVEFFVLTDSVGTVGVVSSVGGRHLNVLRIYNQHYISLVLVWSQRGSSGQYCGKRLSIYKIYKLSIR